MIVLIVNVGSTSLKFKLYDMPEERLLAFGAIGGISQPTSDFKFEGQGAEPQTGLDHFPTHHEGIERVIAFLESEACPALGALSEIGGVGFKTVMGKNIIDCEILDERVLAAMAEYNFLAPNHNPPYLKAIRTFAELLPEAPRVGLFEPAFAKTIPEYAWRYAMPHEWTERYGFRRYGYHGASHRYVNERAREFLGVAPGGLRLVSCHLGGSSSINATLDGKTIDNSFGFTPNTGVMHGTRSHDVDPFLALFLIHEHGWTAEQVGAALSTECGLKGLSGVSAEMKDVLEAAAAGNDRAQVAADCFAYQVRKQVGAFFAVLNGLDVLVFTGGIGERSPEIRGKVCAELSALGVELDEEKNRTLAPDAELQTAASKVKVLTLATNEELMVARATAEKLGASKQ